jgi:hypothetical protein
LAAHASRSKRCNCVAACAFDEIRAMILIIVSSLEESLRMLRRAELLLQE